MHRTICDRIASIARRGGYRPPSPNLTIKLAMVRAIASAKASPIEAAHAAARRLAARRQPMNIRDLEFALIANARKSLPVI